MILNGCNDGKLFVTCVGIQQPPAEYHWGIQGQTVPRPAFADHTLSTAMQGYLQGSYSPTPFTKHPAVFLTNPTYHNDSNAHHIILNSHLPHQQTADVPNFTNIPDHIPSPSPSPNPSLSPNVGKYQLSNIKDTNSGESTGPISNDHSEEIDYPCPNSTPVEYPSPAQSPVEHPAEAIINNSGHLQDIEPYSIPEQKEKCMQHTQDNDGEIYFTANNQEDWEEQSENKKPFKFSPILYSYLSNEQKEGEIEISDWCSQICTPPQSPSTTNFSTPTSSPTETTTQMSLITLTPCKSYLYTSNENTSAVSELQNEKEKLCQGEGSMSTSYHQEFSFQSNAHLPTSSTSSHESDILGDIMAQISLVGVSTEDMSLNDDVIGVMEEKGPSPSFVGESQEMGYNKQLQFACHLCHCIFHDAWNLQVHMVSHPTPTPCQKQHSKSRISSPEILHSDPQEDNEFIPAPLTPRVMKVLKFHNGGRSIVNKENTSSPKILNGKYFCPECNIGYPSQGHMRRHMESHGANRKFPCDMCTASYSRRDNLDKHRNQHFTN